jgi:hypothetical protein
VRGTASGASTKPTCFNLVRERATSLISLFANDPTDPARGECTAWDPPCLHREKE